MSFIQTQPQKNRWISLTPLIDVVFILLMFFMLTTQFSRYSVMNITVANSSDSNASVVTSDTVRITVFSGNEWRLNDASPSILNESSLSRFAGVESVVVIADDSAQLQDVVSLLNALTNSGVTNAVWLPQANDDDR